MVLGWVLFDAVPIGSVRLGEVFGTVFSYIGAMFGANGVLIDNFGIYSLVNYGIVFAICVFACTDSFKMICGKIKEYAPKWVMYGYPIGATAIMLASIAFITTSSYHPFLYFNF